MPEKEDLIALMWGTEDLHRLTEIAQAVLNEKKAWDACADVDPRAPEPMGQGESRVWIRWEEGRQRLAAANAATRLRCDIANAMDKGSFKDLDRALVGVDSGR